MSIGISTKKAAESMKDVHSVLNKKSNEVSSILRDCQNEMNKVRLFD